jgi:hypothetical protein
MRIGQEWVYKGSQNTITIVDFDTTNVTIMFNDTFNEYPYSLEQFAKNFEPFTAKGQVWNLNGGPVTIKSTHVDTIVYTRKTVGRDGDNLDDWNYNKQDFFNKATRIL